MDPADLPDLFGAFERAREIAGEQDGPSAELESEAAAAAAQLGLELTKRRILDDNGFMVWQTGWRHPRGNHWVNVTGTWEDAYRELDLI